MAQQCDKIAQQSFGFIFLVLIQLVLSSCDESLYSWTPSGHLGSVTTIAVMPDNSIIISGSDDSTIKIWNFKDLSLVGSLSEDININALTVSTDGSKIIGGGNDGNLYVWDTSSKKLLFTLVEHTKSILYASVTPDNKHVVSISSNGAMKIWNFSDFSLYKTVNSAPYSTLISALMTPDGSKVIEFFNDQQIKVFNLATGEILYIYSVTWKSGLITSVSPNNEYAISVHTEINVWKISDGSLSVTIGGSMFEMYTSAIFSFDGTKIIAYSDIEKVIMMFSSADGRFLYSVDQGTQDVSVINIALFGRIVIGTTYGALKVLNIHDYPLDAQIVGHESPVCVTVVAHDCSTIASAGYDNVIKVWDAFDRSILQIMDGHKGTIKSIVFNSNDTLLVSGGLDDTLMVWRISEGTLVRRIVANSNGIHSIAASGDNSIIVSGGEDGSIKIWDFDTGALLFVRLGHFGSVNSVLISLDGLNIISGGDDMFIKFWSISNVTLLKAVPDFGSVQRIILSSDGSHIFTLSRNYIQKVMSGDWFISKWDTITYGLLSHSSHMFGTDTNPDFALVSKDRYLSVYYMGYFVKVLDTITHRSIIQVKNEENIQAISNFCDELSFITGDAYGSIKIWNLPINFIDAVANGYYKTISGVVSPDSAYIACGCSDNVIRIWSLNDKSLVSIISGETVEVTSLMFSMNGSILVYGTERNVIGIWDFKNDRLIKYIFTYDLQFNSGNINTYGVTCVTLALNDSVVIAGVKDWTIRVYELSTAKLLRVLTGHSGQLTNLDITKDGTRLISASFDSTIRLWDLSTWTLIRIMKKNSQPVIRAKMSGDDLFVISGGDNGDIVLWDSIFGKFVRFINCFNNPNGDTLKTIEVTKDGSRFLSGDSNGIIKLWSIMHLSYLYNFVGHSKEKINWIAMVPNGTAFLSGSEDSTTKLWLICPPGFFYDKKQKKCLACSPGSYASPKEYLNCVYCPAGTFGNTTGSKTPDECIPCPPGTLNSETGKSSCSECPAGTFSSNIAQTQCIACPTGFYSALKGQKSCLPCPLGSFASQRNSTFCELCPPGTFNSKIGSKSAQMCVPCPRGKFSDSHGMFKCHTCPPGQYNPDTSQTSCKSCPLGTVNPQYGAFLAESCILCPKGTYADESGSFCSNCPQGTFTYEQGSFGISACRSCSD